MRCAASGDAVPDADVRLRVLQRVISDVHGSLELEKVLQRITDGIVDTMGYNTAVLVMLDGDKRHFRTRAMSSRKKLAAGIARILGFSLSELSFPADLRLNATVSAIMDGKAVVTDSLAEVAHPVFSTRKCAAIQRLAGTRNYILMPVGWGDERMGGILVSSARDEVTEKEVEMLEAVAHAASQACANAILHARTKKTEEELRASEERYRCLFEHSQAINLLVDMVGKIMSVNEWAAKSLGYDKDEWTGRDALRLVVPEHRKKAAEYLAADLRGGSAPALEIDVIARDGIRTLLFAEGHSKVFENGEQVGILVSAMDITARKRAEGELKDSEERLRVLFDYAPDAYYLNDLGGVFLDGNKAAEEVTGYKKEDLVGKSFLELKLLPLSQMPKAAACLAKNVLGRPTGPDEFTIRRKDGAEAPVEISTFPVKVKGRTVVLGIARDISDRKQAEEALSRKVLELSSFLDNIPDMAWLKDKDSNFIAANKAFGEAVGVDPAYLISHTCAVCFGEEAAARFKEDDARVMGSRQQVRIEESITNARGEAVPLETIKSPILDERGEVVGTVGIARDITDRKRAEEEKARLEEHLRHAQKMDAIGALAGGVAHDFNNLLTGIMGHANMLKHNSCPGDGVRQSAEVIERAANRAAELTKQLLGFARKGKLQNTPVDMHGVIDDVVAILHRTVDKRIRMTRRLNAGPSFTIGDPGQLQQVVMNLAVNARDAMPDGGELILETQIVELDEEYCRAHTEALPGRYILTSVADTGIGIPEDKRRRIFEPFFTTKEQGKGTGLGLAMVYGIVKNHGGFMLLYSEIGKGTTFSVYLPLAGDAVFSEAETRVERLIPGKGNILIVDDEETVRDVASRMLAALGYETAVVHDGREALDYYRERGGGIDLVIIDMTMPVVNGRDCFRGLRKMNPDVKAVLSTGHALDGAAQELLDEGMLGFVQKPYVMAQLSKVVAEALRE